MARLWRVLNSLIRNFATCQFAHKKNLKIWTRLVSEWRQSVDTFHRKPKTKWVEKSRFAGSGWDTLHVWIRRRQIKHLVRGVCMRNPASGKLIDQKLTIVIRSNEFRRFVIGRNWEGRGRRERKNDEWTLVSIDYIVYNAIEKRVRHFSTNFNYPQPECHVHTMPSHLPHQRSPSRGMKRWLFMCVCVRRVVGNRIKNHGISNQLIFSLHSQVISNDWRARRKYVRVYSRRPCTSRWMDGWRYFFSFKHMHHLDNSFTITIHNRLLFASGKRGRVCLCVYLQRKPNK